MTNLDLALIQNYTGGVQMPIASQAGYTAKVDAAGTNLLYEPGMRAWAVFAGDTGTTVRRQGVSGVTVNSDGNYTIELETELGGEDTYGIGVTVRHTTGNWTHRVVSQAAGSFTIQVLNGGSAAVPSAVQVFVYGV